MAETPVNLENEKKKNLKLALAVASLGVLGFFALYIIFFLSLFSLYPAENKIYFFDKGLYRTFDMKKWEEFKNPEIGSNPKGAVGTEGIWVLSTVMKKPLLKLITETETKEMPLPDINFGDISVCSSQILCLGNELHLFLENNDTLVWFKYDGKQC